MKISFDQLNTQLIKQLSPIYLFVGEEALLVQEAIAAVQKKAKKEEFLEKITFDITNTEHWEKLTYEVQTNSLFSNKKVILCRLPQGKLPKQGITFLLDYAKKPIQDKVLLFTVNKLTPDLYRSTWVQAIEKTGTLVQIWPIPIKQFSPWLHKRLSHMGYHIDPKALQLLTSHVEGNLLAAAQVVEKLALLYSPGHLNEMQVMACLAPAARYTVYDLISAISSKQFIKIAVILESLQTENIEPAIVLWALARECRRIQQQSLFALLLDIDKIIKGITSGNSWQALQNASFALAGKPLMKDVHLA